MIVVKVGGSLFDHPALGPGLRAYLESLAPAEVLLVPGGGPVADAVRELDRVHGLGEEASHWLALKALGATAELLRRLVEPTPPAPFQVGKEAACGFAGVPDCATREAASGSEIAPSPPSLPGKGVGGLGLHVLDCYSFALEDDSRPGALPHTWAVTSDSLAARAAVVSDAERLVLLKSVDVPPGTPWVEAAARGWVDPHFPHVAATLACPIEVRNFRVQLDSRA